VFAVLLRVLGPVVVLLLLTLFGCGHSGRAGGRQRAGLAALGASRCRVTVPNRSTPPGGRPDRGYDGNGALWTALPLDGNVVGIRQKLLSHPVASQRAIGEGVFGIVRADGAVAVKFPWWGRQGATDPLMISGRRLDQPASPLRVDTPPGSGSPGFWASRIIFPTEGCWSITGRAQAGTLTFTVHVMKANELHPPRAAAQALSTTSPNIVRIIATTASTSQPIRVTQPSVPQPIIRQWLIPYDTARKRQMAAYSLRHYGEDTYVLSHPKLIVEHYTETATAQEAFNTFAPDVPDSEFHELPNTCAHFLVEPNGRIDQLVPLSLRCRHTTGLNWTAIGVENVGFSDRAILNNPAQIAASLRLTRWLRCHYAIALKNVIGHNESLSSPYHHDLVPAFQHQTHSDWNHADMGRYRSLLARLACPNPATGNSASR
jgi:N-acetylmuramoyl-L-alanine amidase